MPKELAIIGGGHAHLMLLSRVGEFVRKGFGVTLVGPDRYHYYSGMSPGVLSGRYDERDIRFPVADMVEDGGGRFIKDYVTRIDAGRNEVQLGSGRSLRFDVASFNVGSDVGMSAPKSAAPFVFTAKPIQSLLAAGRAVRERLEAGEEVDVAVFGGGPAGTEITGNIAALGRQGFPGKLRVTMVAGSRLMGHRPEKVRRLALKSLEQAGVSLMEDCHLAGIEDDTARLDQDRSIRFDIGVIAIGTKPPRLFIESGLPTCGDGGLMVTSTLQCQTYPSILGGGDCICYEPRPLDKVGVYAVREAPVLAENALALLEGRQLKTFKPGSPRYMLLYNLGDGTAIFSWRGIIFRSSLVMRLKDAIDRRFMRRFGGGE